MSLWMCPKCKALQAFSSTMACWRCGGTLGLATLLQDEVVPVTLSYFHDPRENTPDQEARRQASLNAEGQSCGHKTPITVKRVETSPEWRATIAQNLAIGRHGSTEPGHVGAFEECPHAACEAWRISAPAEVP